MKSIFYIVKLADFIKKLKTNSYCMAVKLLFLFSYLFYGTTYSICKVKYFEALDVRHLNYCIYTYFKYDLPLGVLYVIK